jgi:hypothetical protein
MQYAAVKAALFTEPPADLARPAFEAHRSPIRLLRDAFEPIAMHQVWAEAVHTALAATGLPFFSIYAWGRAAVLGDVDPYVAAATFAVFEPEPVAAAVRAGQAAIGRTELLATMDRATIGSLHTVLDPIADPAELAEIADRLWAAVEAADGTGRPLFCGVRSLGRPDDALGAVWRACHALREHRGDSHVAAFVAAGFDPVRMNILTELWVGYPLGGYSASRRWPSASTEAALARLRRDGLLDGDTLTDAGRARRDEIEAATDLAQAGVAASLGEHLEPVAATLHRWSDACVEAGFFPPDFRKRHAG